MIKSLRALEKQDQEPKRVSWLQRDDNPLSSPYRQLVRLMTRNPHALVTPLDIKQSKKMRDVGAEINNVCTANCSFCGYGKGLNGKAADPRRKSKIDREALHHLLKIYSRSGGGHFSLTPILGEVSANKNWLELVAEIRSYKKITSLSCFSNAILLDKFGSEAILTSGLTAMTHA